MRIAMPSMGADFAPNTHATPPTRRRWQAFVRRLATRSALLELDDDQLRDIGLSRYDAEREARLTLWRLWE